MFERFKLHKQEKKEVKEATKPKEEGDHDHHHHKHRHHHHHCKHHHHHGERRKSASDAPTKQNSMQHFIALVQAQEKLNAAFDSEELMRHPSSEHFELQRSKAVGPKAA